ncbi:type II secretion system protein GspD [Castellaniella ginsengisoli]|uniref:Type II secretory pathway protein n=1 Tax=Castellaniella ginsengisoli TaxID=546114 RepID=A0AB39DAA8_9BURK
MIGKTLWLSLLLPALAFGQGIPSPLPPIPLATSGEAYVQPASSQVQRVVRRSAPQAFDLQGVSVAEVVQLIYANAVKTPYMLAPEVLADSRPLSFRWSSGYGSLEGFLLQFLDSLGYKVERRGKVDFVMKAGAGERLETVYIYRPKYRSVNYLAELISPMLKGSFSVNRQITADHPIGEKSKGSATATNALGVVKRDSDTLIYRGTSEEIDTLKGLLSQLDVVGGEVMVRALVYEVGVSQKEGSAFSLITSLFDGSLKIGVNTGVAQAANFLSFKNLTIDFIANILSSDNRFKVVSSPSLRIRSGEEGRFNVGQEVPILGSISYPREGAPVQSVEYRSSGVIFNVRPQVYEENINLDLDQQISNFVRTETGVDNSPTLTKREVSTSVSLRDNEIIVLGGLAETKDGAGRTGFSFLPDFLRARTSDSQRSELVVVLQVTRIGEGQD